MKLAEYLDGMRAATIADELEAAIQADFKHHFRGRSWSQICKVRIETGKRIVAAHPNAFYIPDLGPRHKLTCCGETYKVGYGQNSAGVRYSWHYAGLWAKGVLQRNGFGIRAANRLWDADWYSYPHRCIKLVDAILAGEFKDPELNVLIRHDRTGYGCPIKYTIEQNAKEDRRATRPCDCGGILFDWGAGHSEGFDYVNWHCNKCPDVFTEYMTHAQLYELRNRDR